MAERFLKHSMIENKFRKMEWHLSSIFGKFVHICVYKARNLNCSKLRVPQ